MEEKANDETLIRRFQRGDRLAFELFVARHQDRIYRLCGTLLKQPTDQDDATQEVFLRAFNGLGRFRFGAKPFTWLFRTAKNVCSELNRKVREGHDYDTEIQDHRDPRGELGRYEQIRLIQNLLSDLPERQKDVVLLRVFEGMSVSETAQAMRVREGTIKAHLHKAMTSLRKQAEKLSIRLKDYE